MNIRGQAMVEQVADGSSSCTTVEGTTAEASATTSSTSPIPNGSKIVANGGAASSPPFLRHDEQENEDYYDKRDEANDDIKKGRIQFPADHRLYGRTNEMKRLHDIYSRLRIRKMGISADAAAALSASNATSPTSEACSSSAGAKASTLGTSLSNRHKRCRSRIRSCNGSVFGGNSQVVFISGFSGTGKSALVHEFVRHLQEGEEKRQRFASLSSSSSPLGPPRLMFGKYEKLNNTSKASDNAATNVPFSAIVHGLDSFCLSLLNDPEVVGDEEVLEQLQFDIREAVGSTNLPIVLEIVPSMSKLLTATTRSSSRQLLGDGGGVSDGENSTSCTIASTATGIQSNDMPAPSSLSARGASGATVVLEENNSMMKVQQIFCNLIKVFCDSFNGTANSGRQPQEQQRRQRPIIMFLDDIQWIDDGSLALLEALLVDTSIMNFMFVGAYRSNEVQNKPGVNDEQVIGVTNQDGLFKPDQHHIHRVNHLRQVVEKHRGGDYNAFDGNISNGDASLNIQEESKDCIETDEQGSDEDEADGKSDHNTPVPNQGNVKVFSPSSRSSVEQIDISDLTMEDIGQFIADTLKYNGNNSSSDGEGNDDDDSQHSEDGSSNAIASAEAVASCRPLTQAIYHKTLGNIFYTKQALEELVRQNGLYYDVMMFRWEWNISKIKAKQLLSHDVTDMVQNKIRHYLPPSLQRLLTIASLIRSTFQPDLLHSIYINVMSEDGDEGTEGSPTEAHLTKETVVELLDQAVTEGLLVRTTAHRGATMNRSFAGSGAFSSGDYHEYTFSHDRIQEAASSFVSGDAREKFCYRIAMKLISVLDHKESHGSDEAQVVCEENSCDKNNDWMLFVAMRHLNSVPIHFLQADVHDGSLHQAKIQLAKWNLRAAKMSLDKSAFSQAVGLLRAGVSHIMASETQATDFRNKANDMPVTSRIWEAHYSLCLELHNHLLETEFCLGNHSLSQQAVDEILKNARSISDKCLAHHYDIAIITNTTNRDYALAAERGVQYLALHGIHLPNDPKERYIIKERLRLQVVQGRRKLSDLLHEIDSSSSASCSLDEHNDAIMRLLLHVSICAAYVNLRLARVCFFTAQRLSFQHGMNQYLPTILSHFALFLRQRGKFNKAFTVGSVAFEMHNKLSHRGPSWVKGMNACSGCILPLRLPVARSIEVFQNAHRVGLACGDVEWASLSAMQYALCYFCAGSPVTAMFEPKLILFEEEARRYSQPQSVIVTFGVFRQFLLNLQGKGNHQPAILDGIVIQEEAALAEFEGSPYKQTLRDISIFRLILASVFGDDKVSLEMLDRLVPYPQFDFPIAREHLRDLFMGLEAFRLARQNDSCQELKDRKKLTMIGRQKMKIFQRLSKKGSMNARVYLLCLRAEERPSKERYDEAIRACSSSTLLHLEALMNEHCGLHLLSNIQGNGGNNNDERRREVDSYLTRALFLYFDWGALGKVNQLRQQHKCLKGAKRAADSTSIFMKFMSSHASDDTMISITSTT